MLPNLISAIIGAAGVLITAVSSYLIARNTNRKDQTINDRQQLSKDEQQFRSEMRERIYALEGLVDNYLQKIAELEEQLRESRVQYTEMEIENKRLLGRVEELEEDLKQLR